MYLRKKIKNKNNNVKKKKNAFVNSFIEKLRYIYIYIFF